MFRVPAIRHLRGDGHFAITASHLGWWTMAFVLQIDDPVHVENFEYEGDKVFFCRVGIDVAAHKIYFAAAGLDPFPEEQPEYWFGIIERDASTGEQQIILSGLKLAGHIPKGDRLVILSVICSLTKLLLGRCRPKRVSRMTHDTYQGGKGIEKHEIISRVFVECGYRVVRCDSWHRKRAWICEREDEIPVAPTGSC